MGPAACVKGCNYYRQGMLLAAVEYVKECCMEHGDGTGVLSQLWHQETVRLSAEMVAVSTASTQFFDDAMYPSLSIRLDYFLQAYAEFLSPCTGAACQLKLHVDQP